MNVSDLENQLRELRPVAPSAKLQQAIEAELSTRPLAIAPTGVVTRRAGLIGKVQGIPWDAVLTRLCWAAGGAAAAVVFLTYPELAKSSTAALRPGTIATTAEAAFASTESSSEVLHAEASDIFYTSDKEPARAVRYNSVERHVWANPKTGARVEVEVPREDLVLVPVSFQ